MMKKLSEHTGTSQSKNRLNVLGAAEEKSFFGNLTLGNLSAIQQGAYSAIAQVIGL